MNSDWAYVWEIMVIALFLGIATVIKQSIKRVRRFFIPNAIIAGFLGLAMGPQGLNLIQFNADRLGNLVYHLMSVGFIALTLRATIRERNKDVINTGFLIVGGYVLQGILGFGLSLLMVFTFFPNLFPAFGLLLPLGYGQGAAQAFSIGKQWEAIGFLHGGNIGLSVAAMGILWACLGGIPLMNYLMKTKKLHPSHHATGRVEKVEKVTVEEAGEGGSVDRFSVQLSFIGIIYLLTYMGLRGISSILLDAGTFGQTLATLLWGFSFIIATLFAIFFRGIYDFMKKKKIVSHEYLNNHLLERIAGGAFDFMVTASIAAISISILKQYLVPTLVIGLIGGLVTIAYTIFLCRRIYKTDVLENILALYGMLTGIVSTGLALVKEIDPCFESSATRNLVLGSGTGLFIGFPLMLLLNVPIVGYVTGQPILYLYTMLGFLAYFGLLMWLLYQRRPRK